MLRCVLQPRRARAEDLGQALVPYVVVPVVPACVPGSREVVMPGFRVVIVPGFWEFVVPGLWRLRVGW